MATAVELVNAYIRARRDLTARQRLGIPSRWPDRPERLPEDFGELDLAALRAEVVEAWEREHPASAEEPPHPEDGGGWGWIAHEHDAEGLLDFVDHRIEDEVLAHGAAVLRSLMTREDA